MAVAQLVERKLVELDVAGSIPVGHPKFMPEATLDQPRTQLSSWTEIATRGFFESDPQQFVGQVPNPVEFTNLLRYSNDPERRTGRGNIMPNEESLGLPYPELRPILKKILDSESFLGKPIESIHGIWLFSALHEPSKYNIEGHCDAFNLISYDPERAPESMTRYSVATKEGTWFYPGLYKLPPFTSWTDREYYNEVVSSVRDQAFAELGVPTPELEIVRFTGLSVHGGPEVRDRVLFTVTLSPKK